MEPSPLMGKPCIRTRRYESKGGVVVYAKTHVVLVLFTDYQTRFPPCFLPQVREQITGRGERNFVTSIFCAIGWLFVMQGEAAHIPGQHNGVTV
jgi:hypothetical protein